MDLFELRVVMSYSCQRAVQSGLIPSAVFLGPDALALLPEQVLKEGMFMQLPCRRMAVPGVAVRAVRPVDYVGPVIWSNP